MILVCSRSNRVHVVVNVIQYQRISLFGRSVYSYIVVLSQLTVIVVWNEQKHVWMQKRADSYLMEGHVNLLYCF
jgi:hypothetical protein